MNQRTGLDVTPGPADRPAILENGVPGFDRADRDLMSARNQLTDVNIATFSKKTHKNILCPPFPVPRRAPKTAPPPGPGRAAPHRHIIGRINLVNWLVH